MGKHVDRDYNRWVHSFGKTVADTLLHDRIRQKAAKATKATAKWRGDTEDVIVLKIKDYLAPKCRVLCINHMSDITVKGRSGIPNPNKGFPDLQAVLKEEFGGYSMYLEIKRSNWKPPSQPVGLSSNPKWDHYVRQRRWIGALSSSKTITGFVKSVEDVENLMKAKGIVLDNTSLVKALDRLG